KSLFIAALVFVTSRASVVFANPTGLTVSTGSASAQQVGSQLNVAVSQLAVLNWQSFNIQKGETTAFLQPSAGSIVFNVIGGANPSQIFGNLHANGTVILANANGFYFGPDSMIKVGGSFIATTAPLPPDLGSGATWQFTGTPPLASIVNYGQIEVGTGKSLYLIAEKIENHGSLSAPEGDAELLAGDDVLVSERPDGRGLSATLRLPAGSVDNFGRITADAGTIALQAKVVNQDGILQADSIVEKNGGIELIASESLNLGGDSQILARGDNSASGSTGGNVTLKSANVFDDADGSSIITAGGANGGNGGNVEVSAPQILSLNSAMDSRAAAGFTGGHLLLDPIDIVLNSSGSTTMLPAGGTIDGSAGNVSDTWSVNVNTAFKNKNFSQILLAASGNISLSSGLNWDLSASTGLTAGQLTLQAAGDIIFGDKSKIVDANNWGVSLYAGYNFTDHSLNSGVGNIYLNGGSGLTKNGSIQLAAGDINLFAGQSILVAPMNSSVVSGSIFTTGGGNIFAYALAGDIIAGTSNGGKTATSQNGDYNFADDGYSPYPFLGGISTAVGGNVTLIAGNNIDSTPIVPSKQAPGASGTYGTGNVTLIAGRQVTGNYTLADGTGTLLAGVKTSSAQVAALQNPSADPSAYAATLGDLKQAVMQSHNADGNIGATPAGGAASTAPVTLGLISGSWNAWAANDISIKQVLNPNGAFNSLQSFQYDYAPDAAVNFWAGNAIELVGGSYGSAASSVKQTPIYAPTLSLNAGAGGIKIDKSILLAPSSAGSLSIITRDGGNLSGAVLAGSTVLNGITMSDSVVNDYTTYSSEHDNIHQSDPNVQNDANFKPVYLDISGSIGSFGLTVPTFADITVEGTKPFVTPDGTSVKGTYNFGFKGRNVLPGQTTSINVLGVITYRGDLTTINLTADQLADPLPAELFTDSANTFITSKLKFDLTTGKLVYVGVMTPAELAFLLAPSLLVLDKNGNSILQPAVDGDGNPITDADGNPTYVPVTKALVLDDTQKAMISQLATASQSASLGDQGLALAGPGSFNVNANSIDLGVSGGIRVVAPDASLAAISPHGANLNVTTIGDLTMTSTKISNESYLGDVNVHVGGTLDVGGQFTTLGDPSAPKGIFTTSSGNVSVTAQGDVNVNGSRIAAYNGGDVVVTSQTGDVNAGNGGAGYVSLNALEFDPISGLLAGIPATIPGSGILATTVVGSHASLGDITISAPQGSVNASLGGVLQIAFNGADSKNSFIQIDAGKDINASGSGIIGSNIKLQAGGDINGVVIGSQSININSQHNVDVTAVSGGSVDIGAAGSVAGTIVGGGEVNVSGDAISAAVEGGTVSTSGDTSGASLGVPASNVAKDIAETADNANAASAKSGTDDGDDELLKKKKGIALAQKVSRVTVLLPPKN
ncbi:MAG: filamentous hemagglutinin N-terminal domain-containing protein, partial [Verrucomicrobia bacterium]|nr:filamentous hemagglutinin N-terminal domain-containing protein [Verrucomicrobiota bacterium]